MLAVAASVLVGPACWALRGQRSACCRPRAERATKSCRSRRKRRQALVEAEENLQTARDAVDKMYTRAAEEMRDKPQVEQIRRALLEDALRFYRGFLKKKSDDPAIRYESALSQRRVGEIYGFLGDLKESLENHRQATAMLTALVAAIGERRQFPRRAGPCALPYRLRFAGLSDSRKGTPACSRPSHCGSH